MSTLFEMPRAIPVIPNPRSEGQREILSYIREMGGQVRKKDIVAKFGWQYHHNADFCLGNRLCRMVAAGLLVRAERGGYRLRRAGTATENNGCQKS